jgi:hypothetical protein
MADAYNARVLSRLQDADQLFFDEDEVDAVLDIAYAEVSDACPYEDTETLETVEDSWLIDASGITGLRAGWTQRSFHPIFGVEWPVEDDEGNPYAPNDRNYRTYNIIGTDIEMVIDAAPEESGEDVYVRCFKVHDSGTIPDDLVPILVDIAAGHAAISKKFEPIISYYSKYASLFNSVLATLGDLDGAIAEATKDLSKGRKKIEDLRGLATLTIDNATPRLEKAIADIATARTYMNTVALAKPQQSYLQSAGNEMQIAANELRQASAYLSTSGTSAAYRAHANSSFQRANNSISKARTLMSLIDERAKAVSVGQHLKVDGDYLLKMGPKRDWPRG